MGYSGDKQRTNIQHEHNFIGNIEMRWISPVVWVVPIRGSFTPGIFELILLKCMWY